MTTPDEMLAAIGGRPVPCRECGGSGRDVDGSLCPECRGHAMAEVDRERLRAVLAERGLDSMDEDNLAAFVCLVARFGPDWRKELDAPDGVSPLEVWLEVLRAGARSPEEAENAVAQWWHGTGDWADL